MKRSFFWRYLLSAFLEGNMWNRTDSDFCFVKYYVCLASCYRAYRNLCLDFCKDVSTLLWFIPLPLSKMETESSHE